MLDLAVDGDAVVIEQDDQVRQGLHAGKGQRLLADTLHQAAVAGDDIGVVIDQPRAETRPQRLFRDGKATALAMPWPSGPVVVSIPPAWPYSG